MIDLHLTSSIREKWLSAAKLGKSNNQDRAQGTLSVTLAVQTDGYMGLI